ncbi:hypothetical protein [Haladaptatus sp. T7]|uniref:hypothetical protein n=1 Tax=Haladaptatus sp. T7 TaxID=2029368 RepID=UPI0021A2542D|nr:hypothetical protein [Haladaptatus sp. T7]GKZ12764.1 hypothetical protein HAL_06450 [Haladaptatus sp. T7]
MTTTVRSAATNTESHWWILLLPSLLLSVSATLGLSVSAIAFRLEPSSTLSYLPPLVGLVLALAYFTAPAAVAVGIHFDRRYIASVSEWEPRSEYTLLGLAMWFGIGIPLGLLYLYRRHKYVGVP